MRQPSIRTRLTLWYGVFLSLGLILFSSLIWLLLKHALYNDLAASLKSAIAGFEQYIHLEDGGSRTHIQGEIAEFSQSLMLPHLMLVLDNQRHLLYSNQQLTGLPEKSSETPFKLKWRRHRYLAVTRNIHLQSVDLRVLLAITMHPAEEVIDRLGWLLCSVTPVFILFAVGGGYLLSRKALVPVSRISERARSIGVANLSERLAVPQTNDELQSLTESWNGMLERLEIAVSRISRFTSDASHELRTPVAVIRFAAESALRRSRSEPEYRAALEKVQRESERMTRLIEDLLFLARAGVDPDLAAPQPVELRSLLDEAFSDLQPIADAKNLHFTRHLPSDPLFALGSAFDLRRVLLILLDNAVKYTPSGGRVSLHLEAQDSSALIRVADTGIGIPTPAQPHVFERFFRVDPSRSKESGGLGLGLAIAETIAHQHHAALHLQSSEQTGSVFSLALPLCPAPQSTPETSTLPTQSQRA